jgi:hypothetical protein
VNKRLFAELVESMTQMNVIVRGKRAASREFHVYALFVLFLGLWAGALAYGQVASVGGFHKWMDSFDVYKESIRVLDPTPRAACETQLRRILTTIDDNAVCTDDAECTLVSQDPFGSTVPVRVEKGKSLLSDMQRFKSSCDNSSFRSEQNSGLVSVPACVKNRCAVKTSLAERH